MDMQSYCVEPVESTENSARSADYQRGLTPFPKGTSGNPGGRPKALAEVVALARKNSVAAMQRMVDLMDAEDERIALAAATQVLDRAYGKPKQLEAPEDAEKRNVTINIVRMTEDASKPDAPKVSIQRLGD